MAEYSRAALTEADGRQLAADLIRELGEHWKAIDLEAVPDDRIKETMLGMEPVILRRYLAVVQKRKNAALQRGFLSALSDFVGSCVDGGVPDASYYEGEGMAK